METAALAAEFLRALRGKRSQTAFSRRLGYKSNVAYLWEHQRAFPTAAKVLWAAGRVGIDVRAALQKFYRVPPEWLAEIDLASTQGVSTLLTDLKGNVRIVDLAQRAGRNRFAVARWLSGSADPNLAEFFTLIECTSLRLIDFVEQFVSPHDLPSIREQWVHLRVARGLAYDAPWTQAILRALELQSYAELSKHSKGWLAKRIGISREEERRCLELLTRTGQVKWDGQRYVVSKVVTLDMRSNPRKARKLRGWWAREAARRTEGGARGLAYNLLSVSAKDLERLRELQKAYLNELWSIVAESTPVEHVVLAIDTLIDLGQARS